MTLVGSLANLRARFQDLRAGTWYPVLAKPIGRAFTLDSSIPEG